MGFASASCSFSRFKVVDTVSPEFWQQVTTKLRQFAFKDIDNVPEERSWGWVCYEDMLDTQWQAIPPDKGNYIVFSLRLDTRRIPAGVIKKHMTLAMREEKERKAAQGKTFISRDQKKEIKEQVVLRLRQRFLPVPAEFNVIWATDTNTVWFASTQSKMIQMFIDYFTQTFDLHLEQLTPFALALSLLDENVAAKLDTIEATNFATE